MITVNALPNVNAGSDQAVCSGQTVTLSGSGAVSYSWNNGVVNGSAFTPSGTTTYTVTGADANGCQNTDQVTVAVNPLPSIGAGVDQTVCAGMAVTLSGNGGVTYTWSNGVANNTAFSPSLGTTTYTVTGTDANGCQNTDQVTVTVVPVPTAGMNTVDPLSGYPGLSVSFDNTSLDAISYVWDFSEGVPTNCTDINQDGVHTFNSPGTYDVILTASNGLCDDQTSMTVIVLPYEPLVIHVPNVFTPDGDGLNDGFFIDVQNGTSIEVIILNRWGNLMAELHDFTEKWDGTENGNDASEGTYFFKYSISGKDGTTLSGQGFVELFRK
jgi:gliding motility-associated-like protein